MAELSQPTKQLIEKYRLWQESLKPKEGVSVIHVDEVASKVAAFYEQIRTIIDWKEEHLMRRAAITRKLKRRFFEWELNGFSSISDVAEPLVMELIRGGYFPNDRVEESKIRGVQKIIEKYAFIIKNRPKSVAKDDKTGLKFYSWLLEVAACEIEEMIGPSIKEMALIDYMFELMRERIKVDEKIYKDNLLSEEDKDLQTYIAIQQSLFRLDEPIISYNLIKYKYPWWTEASEDELLKISKNIYKIQQDIQNDLSHPLGNKFYSICEKYDTPHLLLGDILIKGSVEQTSKEIQDPALFEERIREAYGKRLNGLKARVRRAAVYSTLSILITNGFSVFVLEVPLAKLISGSSFTPLTILLDIFLPTALMFVLATTIRPPSVKNLNLAIVETMKVTYEKKKADVYEIKYPRKRGLATRLALSFIYLAGMIISLGVIYWTLVFLKFPITSVIINIMFIALILFAGKKIRIKSKELAIEEESGSILGFLSDLLLLPVMGMGHWLSNAWKQYNVIAAFFNALIDMPFSAFIEFLERWRYFIKERKEELR